MISFFRSIIYSRFGAIFALLFICLLALGFVMGDVTGSQSFGGLGGGNVAKVGSQNVTLGEFNDALQNRLKAERKDNPTLDMPKYVAGGGFDATLSQLINRYGLTEFAESVGMAVSKRLIDYEITKIPQTKGIDGKFSQEAMQRFMQQIGVSEKTFREDFRQNFYAQQLLPAVEMGATAPNNLVLPYASLVLEKRKGELAIIPSQAYLPQNPPSEAVLKKYYADNALRFTIPEKRSISYVLFDRSIVDAKSAPTAPEIAQYYKENAAKFGASKTVNISQMIVPTQAAAKSVTDKIAAGQSLVQVAKSVGLEVTNSSDLSKEAISNTSSKAVADAVFAASKGSVATPAKGSLGWYIIQVDAVNNIAAKSLVQATAEIEKLLVVTKKEEAITELTSEIENELSDGKSIAEIAKTQGLTVETTPKLLANGQNPGNPNYKPIPEMREILQAGFQIEEGGDAQLIEVVPNERYAMISIADVEAAAPPPLAAVRPAIVQNWAMEEGSKKAKAAAEQVQKAVASGQSLGQALAALNVRLPAPQTIAGTRGELRQEGKLPPPLILLFSMKNGTAKTLAAPNNAGWFVVQLSDVQKGDATGNKELLANASNEITSLLRQEHAAQFVNAALKSAGVKRNDGALTALRKQLLNPNDGR
jgi:peptidyl-prolyl cis-trans isomerase D